MKKRFLRLVSFALMVMMIFSSIPLNVFAGNTEANTVTDSSMPVTIEAEDNFAQMLTESMTTNTAPENESYFFAGLEIDEKDFLTVNFTNDDDCTLVVSFYDEETEKMLHSEVFEVPAKAKYARFQIDRTKLSEYFVVRAFLLGENNEALCKNLESRDYTKKVMDFKSKTPADFPSPKVVELEDDNFLVLKDGVKRVQSTVFRNKLVSYDPETATYEFESINSHISNLQVGDTFYFDNNKDKENVIIIKVKSIEFSGTNATICAEDTKLEDIFDFVKIDNSIDTDDLQVDTSTMGDGVTYLGKQTTYANNSASLKASEEDEEDKDHEIKVDYGVDDKGYGFGTVTGKATLFEIKDDKNRKFTGNATATIVGDLRAYYCDGYTDVSLTITPTLHLELHFNDKFSKTFSLPTMQGSYKGINFGVRPTLTLSSTVKIDFSTDVHCVVGAGYNSETGFENLSQAPIFKPQLEVEGTVSVTLNFNPFLNFLSEDIIELSLSAPFTINVKAELDSLLSSDRVDGDIMHECNFCIDGDIDGNISVSATLSIGVKDDDFHKDYTADLMENKYFYITPFFYSKDKDDFQFTKCPYKLHKVNFSVYNERDNKPLEDVFVYLGGGLADNDGNGIYTDTVAYTNSSGKISAFYPAGKTTTTFTKEDFLDNEKTVEVENHYTKAIHYYVYMKEHKLHKVTFNVKNNEGEVVPNATVELHDAYTKDGYELKSVTTDSSGKAVAYYYDGVYSPKFSAEKHKDYYGMFDVAGEDTVYNVELKKVPMYKVTFTVKGTDGKPVNYAKILLDGGVADNDGDGKYTDEYVYTDASGKAEAKFEDGTYYVSATAEGYSKGESTLKVNGVATSCTVTLSNFVNGGIIEFGSYPQTEVKDAELIAALNNQPKTWISYEYYSAKDTEEIFMLQREAIPGNFMKYTDVMCDGIKYRGVVISEYRPQNTLFGLNEKGMTFVQEQYGYEKNTIYWFRYEPLKWRVLDAEEGFLMSEKIIDSQPFNNTASEDIYGDAGLNYYQDATFSIYANNYESSSIRSWLNSDFYNTAFTTTEKNRIITSTVDTKCVNPEYSMFDSGITYDKLFLLSYQEVLNESYGFVTYENRKGKVTDYSRCQGISSYNGTYQSLYYDCNYYYLRTPDTFAWDACAVWSPGHVKHSNHVNDTNCGIRPAMRINLSSLAQEEAVAVNYQVEDVETSSNGASATTDGSCALVPDVECIPGNEYIVLNVLDYNENNFKLTRDNLLFINQFIADGYGDLPQAVLPKTFNPASTVLVIGDFGNGIEVRTSSGAVTGVQIDDLAVNYKSQTKIEPNITTTGSKDSISNITYSSSDESIVTVDNDGNVTATGTGEAQITITITDEYGLEIQDTCTVTVSYTWWQWIINIFLLGFLWY